MELRLLAALYSWRTLLYEVSSFNLEELLGMLQYESETKRRKEVMKLLIVKAARQQFLRTKKSLEEMYDMHVPSKILEEQAPVEPVVEPEKPKKPAKKKVAKKKVAKKKK